MKYISAYADRHGRTRYRFRKGGADIAICSPNRPQFADEYAACLDNAERMALLRKGRPDVPLVTQARAYLAEQALRHSGFVYFVHASMGRVKIGFSRNPVKRFGSITTNCPDKLTLLGIIPGTEATRVASAFQRPTSFWRMVSFDGRITARNTGCENENIGEHCRTVRCLKMSNFSTIAEICHFPRGPGRSGGTALIQRFQRERCLTLAFSRESPQSGSAKVSNRNAAPRSAARPRLVRPLSQGHRPASRVVRCRVSVRSAGRRRPQGRA